MAAQQEEFFQVNNGAHCHASLIFKLFLPAVSITRHKNISTIVQLERAKCSRFLT